MTKDEALRLALEALQETWYHVGTFAPTDEAIELYDKAIKALRLAIDVENMASKSTYKEQLETKDEPVGKFAKFTDGIWREVTDYSAGIPLYTTPQRTWVRLTEEDLKPICDEWRIVYGAWMDDFARDIEAKLKEKNNG